MLKHADTNQIITFTVIKPEAWKVIFVYSESSYISLRYWNDGILFWRSASKTCHIKKTEVHSS